MAAGPDRRERADAHAMTQAAARPLATPVAVVTGASGGIGRHIALGLARAGRRVVLVGRDRARTQAALAWIAEQEPAAALETEIADLSCLAAVQALGERVAARHPQITLLVNNAGVFEAKPVTTDEGFDRVLAVNLLAPFVLTRALLPALTAGAPSRIVNVGSSSSDGAHLDPGRLVLGARWSMVAAYGQSKLALLMASVALADHLRGSGVMLNVVHPGLVATGLVRTGGVIGAAWRLIALAALSEAQGAEAPLHVALSPEFAEVSGAYVKKRRAVRPNRQALDRAQVQAVWLETQRLAGPWLAPWPA